MRNVAIPTAAFLLVLSASSLVAAQSFSIRDLGSLRHGSARVHDINSQGDVVGASGHPHGADTHASLWSRRFGTHDLGTLSGGDYSAAFAVNDAGQVVGISNTATGVHAFLWTPSAGMQDLAAGEDSIAYGINATGTIAGSLGAQAAVWNNGTPTPLGTLGGPTSEAHDINDKGDVVGISDSPDGPRAFLWSGGKMQNLGTLPGDTSSHADRISNDGIVVGASEGNGVTRAFVWSSTEGMKPLGVLSGGDYSEAFGLNNLGQVVGESGSSLGTRAFLWTSETGLRDLNQLVPGLPANVVLTGAFAINDKGQIIAFGLVHPDVGKNQESDMDKHTHAGPTHVFLLDPI